MIIPKKHKDMSYEFLQKSSIKFSWSKPKLLSNYNLYKSRFFKIGCKNSNDLQFKDHRTENIIKFEKIIDSNAQNNFIPFLSYQKKIQRTFQDNKKSPDRFDKIWLQALYFDDEAISVTPSEYIDPYHIDRRTIYTDSQI